MLLDTELLPGSAKPDRREQVASEGSVVTCAILNTPYAAYNGPNGWNDPDMLEVGVGKLASDVVEQRSHFNLWAIMAAPLIAGNDLTQMTETVKSILANKKVIDVDQDPLGLQGFPVRRAGTDNLLEIWVKPLNGRGRRAVVLLNKSSVAADIAMTWAVPSHGSVMLQVQGVEPPPPIATQYLSDLTWIYGANGSGPVEKDMTVGSSSGADGSAITLDGSTYPKGLGVAGGSKIIYRLGKKCSRFTAKVNVDEAMALSGSIVFKVLGDSEVLFDSQVMKADSPTQTIDVALTNKYRLTLLVTNGMVSVNSADRGVWADAKVECK